MSKNKDNEHSFKNGILCGVGIAVASMAVCVCSISKKKKKASITRSRKKNNNSSAYPNKPYSTAMVKKEQDIVHITTDTKQKEKPSQSASRIDANRCKETASPIPTNDISLKEMQINDKPKQKKQMLMLLSSLFIIFVICLFSMIGIVRVNGNSMQPTLYHGDYIIYNKLSNSVEVGDIILFERDNKKYVKRVYALPSDIIEINKNGVLLVNNAPQIINNLYTIGGIDPMDMQGKIELGEDEYFVIGDHRNVSLDSRSDEIGPVKKDEIIGIYIFSIRK